MTTEAATLTPQGYLQAQNRWHPLEIAFWLATLLPFVLFPDYLSLASQIAITALFALSLDIILGFAASFIISRFRHFTLIMITLGLGLLAFEAANRAHWLTGGSDGLQGVS